MSATRKKITKSDKAAHDAIVAILDIKKVTKKTRTDFNKKLKNLSDKKLIFSYQHENTTLFARVLEFSFNKGDLAYLEIILKFQADSGLDMNKLCETPVLVQAFALHPMGLIAHKGQGDAGKVKQSISKDPGSTNDKLTPIVKKLIAHGATVMPIYPDNIHLMGSAIYMKSIDLFHLLFEKMVATQQITNDVVSDLLSQMIIQAIVMAHQFWKKEECSFGYAETCLSHFVNEKLLDDSSEVNQAAHIPEESLVWIKTILTTTRLPLIAQMMNLVFQQVNLLAGKEFFTHHKMLIIAFLALENEAINEEIWQHLNDERRTGDELISLAYQLVGFDLPLVMTLFEKIEDKITTPNERGHLLLLGLFRRRVDYAAIIDHIKQGLIYCHVLTPDKRNLLHVLFSRYNEAVVTPEKRDHFLALIQAVLANGVSLFAKNDNQDCAMQYLLQINDAALIQQVLVEHYCAGHLSTEESNSMFVMLKKYNQQLGDEIDRASGERLYHLPKLPVYLVSQHIELLQESETTKREITTRLPTVDDNLWLRAMVMLLREDDSANEKTIKNFNEAAQQLSSKELLVTHPLQPGNMTLFQEVILHTYNYPAATAYLYAISALLKEAQIGISLKQVFFVFNSLHPIINHPPEGMPSDEVVDSIEDNMLSILKILIDEGFSLKADYVISQYMQDTPPSSLVYKLIQLLGNDHVVTYRQHLIDADRPAASLSCLHHMTTSFVAQARLENLKNKACFNVNETLRYVLNYIKAHAYHPYPLQCSQNEMPTRSDLARSSLPSLLQALRPSYLKSFRTLVRHYLNNGVPLAYPAMPINFSPLLVLFALEDEEIDNIIMTHLAGEQYSFERLALFCYLVIENDFNGVTRLLSLLEKKSLNAQHKSWLLLFKILRFDYDAALQLIAEGVNVRLRGFQDETLFFHLFKQLLLFNFPADVKEKLIQVCQRILENGESLFATSQDETIPQPITQLQAIDQSVQDKLIQVYEHIIAVVKQLANRVDEDITSPVECEPKARSSPPPSTPREKSKRKKTPKNAAKKAATNVSPPKALTQTTQRVFNLLKFTTKKPQTTPEPKEARKRSPLSRCVSQRNLLPKTNNPLCEGILAGQDEIQFDDKLKIRGPIPLLDHAATLSATVDEFIEFAILKRATHYVVWFCKHIEQQLQAKNANVTRAELILFLEKASSKIKGFSREDYNLMNDMLGHYRAEERKNKRLSAASKTTSVGEESENNDHEQNKPQTPRSYFSQTKGPLFVRALTEHQQRRLSSPPLRRVNSFTLVEKKIPEETTPNARFFANNLCYHGHDEHFKAIRGSANCYLFIPEKIEGCSADELQRFLAQDAMFDSKHLQKLTDLDVTINIYFKTKKDERVGYEGVHITHEFKIFGSPSRLLICKVLGESGESLYVACVYSPGGLHKSRDIKSVVSRRIDIDLTDSITNYTKRHVKPMAEAKKATLA